MHTNFLKFIKNKIGNTDQYNELVSNINDLDNLTVKDLVRISNTINEPYNKVVHMYCGEGEFHYNTISVRKMVEAKDLNAIRRFILDGGIILHEDTVNLKYRLNEFRSYKFKESLYQEILKILLENDEVKLAQMISSRNLAYNDLSLNTKNVIEYLYDDVNGVPIQYVFNNYSKIPLETREILEEQFIVKYLEAIDIMNSAEQPYTIENFFLDFDFSGDRISYKLKPLYLEFSEENRNVILNKIKGVN